MTTSLPAPKADFVGLDGGLVHLASGGQSPMLVRHRAAFERFMADKGAGEPGYVAHMETAESAKRQIAQLTHLPAQDHAFLGNASEGIGRVLSSITWQPGDNVVVSQNDYASGLAGLVRLADLGVEPRVVPCEGWYIDPQGLLDACDSRTRLLYLSQVTSLTGQQFDVAAMSEALAERDVIFLLDISHALGVVPVDARLADFSVSSGYKFLCAPHMGVFTWNRERRPDFRPLNVGWASGSLSSDKTSYTPHADARRAEIGNTNYLDVYLLNESLDYLLDYGIESIAAHTGNLVDTLHAGLVALGLEVVTPASRNERGSSVSFAAADTGSLEKEARGAGILLWSGSGRLRATTHLYNSADDIARYLAWLSPR